ncbi:inverse autotransporter beta domain-containing protein [Xenorhabdus anantnagensis]|uniref:Inverse autotransporter beta domain-containing protein n=1 Tax=Xenorhabdus anantnagensis TaxID=3025875 RepID=A0ABT5LRH3_9GAMM|nr:inverse autotransporter beta domain-containing protein [Xenorhabdus anantnagensis]MDC9597024.1 inverse autotransporter beta domain-containing protein [Xenorhabdus anantnagensis]
MNKKFDKPWLQNQQELLKRVAWVNIITQLVFPIAGAFTPAIATAKTHSTFQNEKWALPTAHYVLKSGETVNSVAKRYGLTVSDLKKINQLRTFDKPFTALGVGSEIDVPKPRNNKLLPFNYYSLQRSPLDRFSLDKAPITAEKASTTDTTDKNAKRLAEFSSRIGRLLSSDDIKNNAVSQLNNLAMGEASQQIQNWLGRYGTARVQTNMDSHGHLNNSQFDMLLPLYDNPYQLAFTQFGLRHIDKRNTINIGFGQRQFFDGWMLGYNAFFDHDITGDNSRLGLGAEYARNYLKLSTNGYFRLSNWKESHLLTDYDERPANGFDLKVQGYCPSLPQLGGKLMYEQYFGDEVGLINKDHRKKDPSAFTIGINYTPIPLLTFGIDRKQNMSGSGDTQFNMALNYEIGTPWSKQTDPDAVAAKRTLQGSRYDLVERNNQIVLEYRKREVISLAMDNQIIGHAGEIKPLHLSVNSKYGFNYIQWDATRLRANGGQIKHKGDLSYLLTLPKYQSQGNNIYTVGAIAYDKRGNASKRVETQVQVLPERINNGKSTFTTKDTELLADDHSTTILTLTLKNKDNHPVSGVASDIKLLTNVLSGEGSDPKIATMKETQPGVYQSLLTAGKKTGILKVTPKVYGITINPVEITFVHPDAPIVKNLTISGKLVMGQKLSATYTFYANHGDTVDKSRYVWGNKGSIDISKGNTITESGKIPDYTLTQSDAGTVKALAVQAQNGLGLIGNTQFVDSSMESGQGNDTRDGGRGGTVRGLADKITITMSANKVKKDEPITLKIKTLNHGKFVRNVAVNLNAIKALNRKNESQKISILLNGKLGIYQDFSDNQGILTVTVTDPNGLGVKTTLSAKADGSAAPESEDAIFTVITSPDVPDANFWGHMAETITLNGVTFRRPLLQVEAEKGHRVTKATHFEHGELWHRRSNKGAFSYCKNIMHAALPTKDELVNLSQVYAGKIQDMFGWPDGRAYRSSTPGTDPNGEQGQKDKRPVTGYYSMTIDHYNPHVISDNTFDYVSCKN